MMSYILFPLSLEFKKIEKRARIFKVYLNFSYRLISVNAHDKKLENVF
jgi:hypothetical protein